METRKEKVYISGAISGHNFRERLYVFARAEHSLREKGYETVNPFDNGLPETAKYEEHIKTDLTLLLGCDSIYMLRGWEESSHDYGEPSQAQQAKCREEQPCGTDCPQSWWWKFPTQSPVCNRDDGLSAGLADITFSSWRRDAIKALGNAWVPQVAYEIFRAIQSINDQ